MRGGHGVAQVAHWTAVEGKLRSKPSDDEKVRCG